MQNAKTAILTISEALNFELLRISYLKMLKIPKNLEFGAEMVRMAVFDLLKSAKIDFQILVKSE